MQLDLHHWSVEKALEDGHFYSRFHYYLQFYGFVRNLICETRSGVICDSRIDSSLAGGSLSAMVSIGRSRDPGLLSASTVCPRSPQICPPHSFYHEVSQGLFACICLFLPTLGHLPLLLSSTLSSTWLLQLLDYAPDHLQCF